MLFKNNIKKTFSDRSNVDLKMCYQHNNIQM